MGGCVALPIECVLEDLVTVMMGNQARHVLDPVVVDRGGGTRKDRRSRGRRARAEYSVGMITGTGLNKTPGVHAVLYPHLSCPLHLENASKHLMKPRAAGILFVCGRALLQLDSLLFMPLEADDSSLLNCRKSIFFWFVTLLTV